MLADKTLLSVTLAATFASGCFVGAAVRPRPAAIANNASAIYAPQLHELELQGYDDSEMAEARKVYEDYFASYGRWWDQFLEDHQQNVDTIEDKLTKRLDALEVRHQKRAGAK